MTDLGKRKEPRHDFGINIYNAEGNLLGQTNNLSRNGCSFKAIQSVKVGDLLDIFFEIPDSPEWLSVKCLVKWKANENMGGEISMDTKGKQVFLEFIQPWDEAFG